MIETKIGEGPAVGIEPDVRAIMDRHPCGYDTADRVAHLVRALEEIENNCINIAAGELPHLTRADVAHAAAGRARGALEYWRR